MFKILFISCNLTKEPYPVYPLGMSMLADFIRGKGFQVIEWDFMVAENSVEKLQRVLNFHKPDIIGLSIRNVDNINYGEQETYLHHYKEIIKEIRRFSSVPVVAGGSAFSLFPAEMLSELETDYGIVGEGENVFISLIENIKNGKPPKGKILYAHDYPECNDFHSISRNPVLADFYLNNGGMLNIQTKRGCPHRCAYCSYPLLEGHKYRFRPADEVIEEIIELRDKYKADYIFMTDSVFNDTEGRYMGIIEKMLKRDISIPWMAFFRPDEFADEEVKMLKASGLKAIEWGTDCSSDTTLSAMRKDFNWKTAEAANNLFASNGIANSHFIIFGGPGETRDTVMEGLENISRLEKAVVFASLGIRIFPGTHIHRKALDEGFITKGRSLLNPVFYFSPEITPEFLNDAILKSFKYRMDRVYPWEKKSMKIIKAFHDQGYRGPVWDFILRNWENGK